MEPIVIEQTSDFVNGGCNACPTVKCFHYVLNYHGKKRALDELLVESIVSELAMCEGFAQKMILDFDEESIQFYKRNQVVTLHETGDHTTYQTNQAKVIVTKQDNQTIDSIFVKAATVLQELFAIQEVTFQLTIKE